jgi:hypothetical protein
LREINRAPRTTQTSAINNRDQLKSTELTATLASVASTRDSFLIERGVVGVAQVASGALAALKERDYGQFACCIHLLCKVALAVYRQVRTADPWL